MKKIIGSALVLLAASSIWLSNYSPLNAAVNPAPTSSPAPNKLKISSQEAKWDRKNQIALATGNVKIVQDTTTIYTSSVLYNQGIQTSFIDQFVRIIHLDKETKRKTDISSNKMIVYHKEKKVHLEDKVKFDREEERKFQIPSQAPQSDKEKSEQAIRKERTVITSNASDYWTKTGDAIFTGNAVVLQKEKRASGETIAVKNDANKNTDTITITSNAKITQIRGDWLVDEKIVDPKGDKEKERLVKEKLDMTANKITIFQKTSDLIGEGNVKIIQVVANKKREATGDKSVYNDLAKTMTLTGNVRIKRENEDWITSEKAVFHTDSENFEAYAQDPNSANPSSDKRVESEFTIPDEENPTPEPPINTPEPYFDLGPKSTVPPSTTPKPAVTPAPPKPSNPPPVILTPPPPVKTPIPADRNPYGTPVPSATPRPLATPSSRNTPASLPSSGEFSFPNDSNQ